MLRWIRRKRRQPRRVRTNEEWVRDLRGQQQDQALEDLRLVLIESLQVVLVQRSVPEADALAEDCAQEALLKILEGLDTFRGASRFTTWARTIAVRIAFTELRRKHWQNVSIQDLLTPDQRLSPTVGPAMVDTAPERSLHERAVFEMLHNVIQQELTERQRTAILAVMIHEMPLEEVAQRLGTSRNALYKLLYDARKRLKSALEARGLSPDELPPYNAT